MAAEDQSTLDFVKQNAPPRTERNKHALPSSWPSALPSTPQSFIHVFTKRLHEVDTHPLFLFILIVILGHLQIYFSPFRPLLSCGAVFGLSHVHDRNHQTARKGGGNMRSLPHILPRRPLCWRRHTRRVWFACVSCQGEHVCMCVSLRVSLCTCG